MRISRTVIIDRPVEEVFDYVADPRNDPAWCRKVRSVEPLGDAHFLVIHQPVPFRPPRRMRYERLELDRPHRIRWREDDGTDRLVVSYVLEAEGDRTRFTQIDDAQLGAARILHPLMRIGIGHDIATQLRALRRLLENRAAH